MRLLTKLIHKDIEQIAGRIFERRAARGIILNQSKILLMYTRLYNDYSLPGGGVDSGEDLLTGLKRELAEETGARNVEVVSEFGYTDEVRPHHKAEYDLIHMVSYLYVCKIDDQFEAATLEDYEIANGMDAVWIDIHEAIRHNQKVMANQEPSMGLSIERETFVMKRIVEELLTNKD